LLLENEHVRVLEYVLLPGEQDQWHTHPPKVSYVLSGGKLEIHLDDGTSFLADEKTGTADWAGVRGKHYVKNVGATPVRILLVEDKAAAREVTSPPSSPVK
jgi:quercetin dioxygenase-like cupin family protein